MGRIFLFFARRRGNFGPEERRLLKWLERHIRRLAAERLGLTVISWFEPKQRMNF